MAMVVAIDYREQQAKVLDFEEAFTQGGIAIDPLMVRKDTIGYIHNKHDHPLPNGEVEDAVRSLYQLEMTRLSGYRNEDVPNHITDPLDVLSFMLNGRNLSDLERMAKKAVTTTKEKAEKQSIELTREQVINYGLGAMLYERFSTEKDDRHNEHVERWRKGFPLNQDKWDQVS
jgi:hypothetical protein